MTTSSVVHMVLVRWKPGRSREHQEQLVALVRSLPGRIPGVLSAHCGPSSSPEGRESGYEWALVVTFASPSARDGYLPHPAHEPLKDLISEGADDVLVFDLDLHPPTVPELEVDENVAPRPEEEIADLLRAEPDVGDHSRHPSEPV